MPYKISARAYLKRARNRLNEGTNLSLFYAAFELRAGIQARMQEYLHAQESVAQHKKEEWQLGKLARSLEEVFQLGDSIAQVAIFDEAAGKLVDVLFYTPVTSDLRRDGERLGELLHAMQSFKDDKDQWWLETRRFLESVCDRLETACSGTLLGPLLRDPDVRGRPGTGEVWGYDHGSGASRRPPLHSHTSGNRDADERQSPKRDHAV